MKGHSPYWAKIEDPTIYLNVPKVKQTDIVLSITR